MKKLKYLILLIFIIFIICGCTNQLKKENKKEISTSTPLLLEVTKKGINNKMYLFGSIHVGEESLYPLPDYVMNAYKNSDIIAVEFDLIEYEKDLSSQINHMAKFVNIEGKTIQDFIEEDTYNSSVEILKNADLYSPLYNSYNPIIWQMLIENAASKETNLDSEFGIDKHFLKLSKDNKKEILELESAEIQYNLLASFDYETQVFLLKQTINEYKNSINNLKKLYESYKKGNKEELEKIIFTVKDLTEYEIEYNKKLITDRNISMTNSLKNAFSNNKNIFCTVGLAHIIGEGGIADLLEQEGYTIKIIK